jgi:hypothetical protein
MTTKPTPKPTVAPTASTATKLPSTTVYEPKTLKPLPSYGKFVSLTEVLLPGQEMNINVDNSQKSIKQILNQSDPGSSVQHDLFNAVLLALLAQEQNSGPGGPTVPSGPLFINPIPTADSYGQIGKMPEEDTTAQSEAPLPVDVLPMPEPAPTPAPTSASRKARKYAASIVAAALAVVAALALRKSDDKKAATFSALALASAIVA